MSALVELRVLEGPNLYFPRAAIKLTLDLTTLIDASEQQALRFAQRIGLTKARPGEPGSGFRQRFALRAVGRLVRHIADEAGTTRLAVRMRPTSDVHRIVLAYPWRHRTRAQALGQAAAQRSDDGIGVERTMCRQQELPHLEGYRGSLHVAGVTTDRLYPLRLSEEIAAAHEGSVLSVIESRHGHDGFLVETEQVGAIIARALSDG